MAQLDKSKYQEKNGLSFCFAGFPGAKIYKEPKGSAWKEHLLFGDFIIIRNPEVTNNRVEVSSRGSVGWIKTSEINAERVLEVNFLDIGQGDGCHLVTPDYQQILIDAGEYDNLNRYLWWRFNLYNKTKPLPFDFKVVISHSDQDHYKGFEPVFKNDKIRISQVYHNGIVERPGESSPFGKVENGYIYSLVSNTDQMKEIINDPAKRAGDNSSYPITLYHCLKNNPEVKFKMVSADDEYLEGFGSGNQINGKRFSIEILGPLVSTINGVPALKSMNDAGKDKNGHSVLMKIIYGNAKILLGGDINEEFGEMITNHYKPGVGEVPRLQVDVAKACHHGSSHFHYGFIQTVNALATVISSGDDESFSHPRPDALGAFGKCGYGNKPLIFSTELARSNKEITRKKLDEIVKLRESVSVSEEELKKIANSTNPEDVEKAKKLRTKISVNNKTINSNLTKFGMINLRTDGELMIIAQKLERSSVSGKWDIQKLKYDNRTGRFELMEE